MVPWPSGQVCKCRMIGAKAVVAYNTWGYIMSKETKNEEKEKEIINGMSTYALQILIGDMIANPLLQQPSTNKYESRYKLLLWRTPQGLNHSWKKAQKLAVGAEFANGEHITIEFEDRWQGHSKVKLGKKGIKLISCLLYTSPSPRDRQKSRMPSSA